MKKRLFYLFVIGFIFSLSSCGGEGKIDSSVEKTNMEYNCPLCKEVTLLLCPDCEGELIWCNIDGNITSLICDNCEFIDYPSNNGCFNCEKEMRTNEKFWTNRNGKNYKDCDFEY